MIKFAMCFGCANFKELKTYGSTQFCKECAPPEKIKKVKKYIKPMSTRRAKQNTEYLKVRRVYLIDNPTCQFKGCNNESNQIHHKKGRVEAFLCDVRHFMAVCFYHHMVIEDSPAEAIKLGYTKSRLNS